MTGEPLNRLFVVGMGDVTTRLVLPAIAQLHEADYLPASFELHLAGRKPLDEGVEGVIEGALGEFEQATVEAITSCTRHHVADATSADDLTRLLEGGPAALHLALPPQVMPDVAAALAAADVPRGTRLLVEKPFGTDLASAEELDERLRTCVSEADVYRIDHVLGDHPADVIMRARTACHPLDDLWCADHIAAVDIVWDETLAMEGRGGSYDSMGALRDMVQNHLLQLLSLVAMEPPEDLDAVTAPGRPGSIRPAPAQLEALRATRLDGSPREASRRARYTEGQIGGEHITAYAETEGVDPEQATETWTEIRLVVETDRWRGVPFTLRTGKALARDCHEIALNLREVASEHADGPGVSPVRITISPDPPTDRLSPYALVLRDALSGEAGLSVTGGEVRRAWELLMPVLEAWERDEVPLEEYPAGSDGP